MGAWVARNSRRLERLAQAMAERAPADATVEFDLAKVSQLDTLGAVVIENIRQALGAKNSTLAIRNASTAQEMLLAEIATHNITAPPPPPETHHLIDLLADFGLSIRRMAHDAFNMNVFLGETVRALGRLITGRSRFRMPAVVNQIELIGMRGVPIIMLISFLVGAILSQQMILQLSNYGATLLVVYTLAVLMFREVGLLLAAIMVAGRSGSAITAELGSMKMREEIDAMHVMGLDPMEVLIIPRILAMIISLPLLTFLAAMAGMFGGALVAWGYGGITPTTFLQNLRDSVTMHTFLAGLIKAPVMALMIGTTACIEGMKVEGSAESLGRQTTTSVVKSMFIVIVVDGIFAMFFASINF
ncbi:MlaE family ABC transporter permease [Labrys monachus]|uniref:Phospholipid/cholesterol/gamma-HCH transport system permease protein n=1 Tax=Labrys monachus TaxID=217067 RepID=A0ABU0FKL9_9HYPH|nr:ABC transporter permease [Labrys monachus]MDQ0395158.1 phospholipid/cholesterol/gamma-HCH transport system permease protein [Labrys monachus]